MLSYKYTTFKLTNFKVAKYIISAAISIILSHINYRTFQILFILYKSFEMAFIVAFVLNDYLYYLFIIQFYFYFSCMYVVHSYFFISIIYWNDSKCQIQRESSILRNSIFFTTFIILLYSSLCIVCSMVCIFCVIWLRNLMYSGFLRSRRDKRKEKKTKKKKDSSCETIGKEDKSDK